MFTVFPNSFSLKTVIYEIGELLCCCCSNHKHSSCMCVECCSSDNPWSDINPGRSGHGNALSTLHYNLLVIRCPLRTKNTKQWLPLAGISKLPSEFLASKSLSLKMIYGSGKTEGRLIFGAAFRRTFQFWKKTCHVCASLSYFYVHYVRKSVCMHANN